MKEHDVYLISTIVNGVVHSKTKVFEFGKGFPRVELHDRVKLLTDYGIQVVPMLVNESESQLFAYSMSEAKGKDVDKVYKKHNIFRFKLSARALKDVLKERA